MANTKITNPELFNLGGSTSATQLPVMTTTERIAMNTPQTLNVDYLVVAGGGGGASGYGASGAGGGAGEYLYKTAQTLTFGGSGYTVTVGAGGIGGQVTNSTVGSAGAQGGDSVFIQTTKGGGFGRPAGGSPAGVYVGSDGGSGGGGTFNGAGGASIATSPGLGFAGGAGYSTTNYGSGGGGGAGSAGINGTSTSGGNGGAGVQNSITGVSPAPYYAAGGGGGLYDRTSVTGIGGSGIGGSSYYNQNATDGAANTGSGGGGACQYLGNVYQGGDGGSGVVILRYPSADVASYTTTGLTPTETIDGTDTILSFTTVGTGTITFTSSTPTDTISTGETIFNSDTDKVEYFDGTKWYGITYEANNLILWLNADDANSWTGSGSTWFDVSNNNYNATITTAVPGTGTINGATYLNLSTRNDYFKIPYSVHSGALNMTSGSVITWLYWIKLPSIPTGTSGLNVLLKASPAGLTTNQTYLRYYDPSVEGFQPFVYNANGTAEVNPGYIAPINRNDWVMFVASYDFPSNNFQFHRYQPNEVNYNNTNLGSVSPQYTGNSDIYLFNEPDSVYGGYGQVGEIRAYNTIFTTAELDAMYNNQKGKYGIT